MFSTTVTVWFRCVFLLGLTLALGLLSSETSSAFEEAKLPSRAKPSVSRRAQPSPAKNNEQRTKAFEKQTNDSPTNHPSRTKEVSHAAVLEQPQFGEKPIEIWRPVDFIARDQWIPDGEPPPKWFETYRANDNDGASPRHAPWGNGHIVITDPAEYPRIPNLDNDDPTSIFFTSRANLFGQDVSDEWDFYNLINTDRPDFTDATYSAGKGVTIIESGYTLRSVRDHQTHVNQTRRTLPEVLVRYGLTDEFELRMKWNGYVMTGVQDTATGLNTQIFGGDDLYLAFKYEILQQAGWSPMLTFLSGATVPTGTNGNSANGTQPFVNFVGGWGIRRWLYLKVSTGVDWNRASSISLMGNPAPFGTTAIYSRDHLNLYHNSISLLYQATKRVGGFIEFFNLCSTGGADNRPANYVDTGLFIYSTTNVQWDIRYGKRLSDRIDEYFAGGGFSVRF